MLYVNGADDIRPNARLDDLTIIRNIVMKCGYKMKTAPTPVIAEDTEVKVEQNSFIKIMINKSKGLLFQ